MNRENDDWFWSSFSKALKDSGVKFDAEKLSKIAGDVVRKTIPEASEILLNKLKSRAPDMLRARRADHRRFEKNQLRKWKRPIDRLEMFLVMSFEAGEELNGDYQEEAFEADDCVFDVLRRLHARACQTVHEILSMLKNGFADGAHARWRTLHEIAVISTFIEKHGQEVAKRFLAYEVVQSWRQAKAYQEYHRELGYEPLNREELLELENEYNATLSIYGRDFDSTRGNYGWIPSDLIGRQRTFKKVEKSVGLDHQRPYYNMACFNVHSGPKGLKFRLGLLGDKSQRELLLAGPSPFGLADPGQGAAISLHQITVTLLLHRPPTVKRLIILKALEKLLGEICLSFVAADSKLKEKGGMHAPRKTFENGHNGAEK